MDRLSLWPAAAFLLAPLAGAHAQSQPTGLIAQDDLASFSQHYAEAWSSRNPDRVAGFFSDDGRLTINDGEPAEGRAAIAAVARSFMQAFPDLVVVLDRLERKEGRVLFHWTLTGTNTGPDGTGAPVRISGVEAWLIGPDGLIAESVGSFDEGDHARQLAGDRLEERSDASDVNRIRAAIAAWVEIYNRGDWTLLAAQFTQDAVMMPPRSPAVLGRQAIAAWQASNEAGFRIALLPDEVSVAGDRALVRGRSCVFIPVDGGRTGIDVGKYLEVRQRQPDGRWLISHDVFNSDLPAGSDLADSCPDEIANGIPRGSDEARVPGQSGLAELMQVLDNRNRLIVEGIRSGDVSEIMALYGPGSLYAADNATLLTDPEAIEAFWLDVAASPAQDATLEVLRIERLGPDAFVEIQKYDVFDEAGGRLFGGYASLLWHRVGGRWIIAADVSNGARAVHRRGEDQ